MSSALVPRPPAHAVPTILQFLRHHVGAAGAGGLVVGLSGGLDSALVARLAADALGPQRVLGVLLPDTDYPSGLRTETEAFADRLGIEHRTVEIAPVREAFEALLPEVRDRVALGNVVARTRMVAEYAIARERRYLVAGTGNKSELLLGYFTKYGDGGVDLLPIGDLYKTEVRAVAEALDLPAGVRDRAPSAGLWEGQTDEAELGITYAEVDRILRGLEELRDEAEIARLIGSSPERVREVAARVDRERHKRRPPPIPKLGLRTIGLDWRD